MIKVESLDANLPYSKRRGTMVQVVVELRRCQSLRMEMMHFVTNLQYSMMFEVGKGRFFKVIFQSD